MWERAAIESSKAKRRLLQDPELWPRFDSYFAKDRQAQEILGRLQAAGADLRLLGEFGIWTFHPLASDEAKGKLARGKVVKRGLKKAIAAHESIIEAYSLYSNPPRYSPKLRGVSAAFKEMAELEKRTAARQREMLVRAESSGAFKVRRLGTNWKRQYIFLLQAYISRLPGWIDGQILSAITYFVAAAHEALGERVPHDLRTLLRKSLQGFERDPQNRTAIALLDRLVANPRELYRLFPPVRTSVPPQAAT